ncbi:MAG: 1-deoxy-D-xylulose-5-phosphate synthase N-terminal domain-containing protein, partial [Maribacter sp.]
MKSILEHINLPNDLKSLKVKDLEQLAVELREFIIDIV